MRDLFEPLGYEVAFEEVDPEHQGATITITPSDEVEEPGEGPGDLPPG